MHSETFLTYGMTIVHLGVSLSLFLPSCFLVLAASILLDSHYSSKLSVHDFFLSPIPVPCYICFQLLSIVCLLQLFCVKLGGENGKISIDQYVFSFYRQ